METPEDGMLLRIFIGKTDSEIHTAKILRLSEDLPIIIEIIDAEENLNKILPYLDESIKDGFVTMEKVRIIKYGDR